MNFAINMGPHFAVDIYQIYFLYTAAKPGSKFGCSKYR